jgi:hypothetical protein
MGERLRSVFNCHQVVKTTTAAGRPWARPRRGSEKVAARDTDYNLFTAHPQARRDHACAIHSPVRSICQAGPAARNSGKRRDDALLSVNNNTC